MLDYVRSLQRRLHQLGLNVNLFDEETFKDPIHGLIAATNDCFAEQQSRGTLTKPNNVLTKSDVETILKLEECNIKTAQGYRNRFVFAVGLGPGIRTSEL